MSRGLGWVQLACLHVIKRYEDKAEWPTTYNIAAYVYQVKPDKHGNRWVNDAQHVAVKRALEGLQRQGRIIGFRTQRARDPGRDGRTELCHHWMTEKGLAKWLSEEKRSIRFTRSYGGQVVLPTPPSGRTLGDDRTTRLNNNESAL